jgi:hypothetical protein
MAGDISMLVVLIGENLERLSMFHQIRKCQWSRDATIFTPEGPHRSDRPELVSKCMQWYAKIQGIFPTDHFVTTRIKLVSTLALKVKSRGIGTG